MNYSYETLKMEFSKKSKLRKYRENWWLKTKHKRIHHCLYSPIIIQEYTFVNILKNLWTNSSGSHGLTNFVSLSMLFFTCFLLYTKNYITFMILKFNKVIIFIEYLFIYKKITQNMLWRPQTHFIKGNVVWCAYSDGFIGGSLLSCIFLPRFMLNHAIF